MKTTKWFLGLFFLLIAWTPVQAQQIDNDPLSIAERLRKAVYSFEDHPLTRILTGEQFKSVGISSQEGKLRWVHPKLKIGKLGINPDAPLTARQQRAFLHTYAIKTVTDGSLPEIGTAGFPEDVGRAVNPRTAPMPIEIDGVRYEHLVSKGIGKTTAENFRDGTLELSEALLDAEISRSLSETGARIYQPVAVIETTPGNAIYIRAAQSLLRQKHLTTYDPSTMEGVIADVARRSGAANPKEWVSTYLAETMGKNAGIMNEMGVRHASFNYFNADNYGLNGELVDWGGVQLGEKGWTNQIEMQSMILQSTVGQVNRLLASEELKALPRAELNSLAQNNEITIDSSNADAEVREKLLKFFEGREKNELRGLRNQISVEEVKARFDAAVTDGERTATGKKIQINETIARGATNEALQELYSGYERLDRSTTMDTVIEKLRNKGIIADVSIRTFLNGDGGLQSRLGGSRTGEFVKGEMRGVPTFLGAYLLSQTANAFWKRNPEYVTTAAKQMTTPTFWKSFGAFIGASSTTNAALGKTRFLPRAISREALPLTLGIAAIHLANGDTSTRNIGISAGTFLGTSLFVNRMTALPLRLTRIGGWQAQVLNLSATLFLAEKIENRIHNISNHKPASSFPFFVTPASKTEGLVENLTNLEQATQN